VRWLFQTAVVTQLNLRSLPQRFGASVVAVLGFAGVVAVFVAVLSIAEGFGRVMERGGREDVALVLRGGSDSEMTSGLSLEQTRIIKDASGVLRNPAGPVASAELFVIVDVPYRSSGTDANVPLRGVEAAAFDVRDDLRIVEGRRFVEGRNELVVGRAAASQFAGLDLGNRLRWGENEWEVVGLFDANGSVFESEIWADAWVVQPAYRRGNTFQSVFARLESADAFRSFKDVLTSDPRLDVDVHRESEWFAQQSRVLRQLIGVLGNLIAVLMAVGATFGALNTMYNAVTARRKEIATLRALGFQSFPVVLSVMVESVMLAVVGGALGGGVAWLTVNGYQTATINWQTFSQVAFSLAVTPSLLVGGIVYALIMGFVGGIFPAIRAARTPVAVALRRT
jgi:putative ABC transport system permease protein